MDTFKIVFTSCQGLFLPNAAAALAMSYLHKYLSVLEPTSSGDETEDLKILQVAAIFLGCKTVENLRSMRDIYNVVSRTMDKNVDVAQLDKDYILAKEKIIEKEHELLRVLSFDVQLELPHKYLLNMARHLKILQRSVRTAWSMLNGAFLSSKCAQTRPEVMAAACLLLVLEAPKHLVQEAYGPPDPNAHPQPSMTSYWWHMFDIDDREVLHAAGWICKEYR